MQADIRHTRACVDTYHEAGPYQPWGWTHAVCCSWCASPRADDQRRMRVVDGEQEAVAAAQARQPPQVRPVPVHAEQTVRHHQLALTWVLKAKLLYTKLL